MDNSKKSSGKLTWLLFTLGLVATGAVVWFTIKKTKSSNAASTASTTSTSTTQLTPASSNLAASTVSTAGNTQQRDYLAYAWLGGLSDTDPGKKPAQDAILNKLTAQEIDALYDIVVNKFNKQEKVTAEQQAQWNLITNKYNIMKG